MAAGYNIQIRGLDQVIRKLNSYPNRLAVQIKGELKTAAEEVATLSRKDAPYGIGGKLRQSIVVTDTGKLSNTVSVNADYAAFMEWGTKGKTVVPGEISAYAAQFKGAKAGSGAVTLQAAIEAWVKRKGIGGKTTKSGKVSRSKSSLAAMKSAAFLIARSIYKNGVTPHPFFFKNVFIVRDKLEQRILNIASDAGL